MSTGEKVSREFALPKAHEVMRLLNPVCERIEIAGSLRRGKPEVGDIEIVCIPKPTKDLFGNTTLNSSAIENALSGYTFIKNGEHFKQFDLGTLKCDLFITNELCWGVIFLIRTGSADFSHKMVTPKKYGGFMPSHLHVKDGRLCDDTGPCPTPEEKDVFAIYGMDFIPPEARI
jgi:DNA polymerase/3'-5' exonuclease PolX